MTAPALCAYHAAVVDAMQRLSHVDEDVTNNAARDIARQCPQCPKETP